VVADYPAGHGIHSKLTLTHGLTWRLALWRCRSRTSVHGWGS
jgi:hypothetical protein